MALQRAILHKMDASRSNVFTSVGIVSSGLVFLTCGAIRSKPKGNVLRRELMHCAVLGSFLPEGFPATNGKLGNLYKIIAPNKICS